MKKYSILLLFVLLGLKGYTQGISFTVFAEPQVGWFSSNSKNVEAAGSMIGFNGGLNFDNYFAENYAFSTGVGINNINGKVKYLEPSVMEGLDSTYTIQNGTWLNITCSISMYPLD